MPAAKPMNSRHFATWFTLIAVLAGGAQAAADPGFIAGDNDGARVALSVLNVATVPHADPVRQAPEPSQDLLARLRDIWRAADQPDEPRDLMRLERDARSRVRWPAVARFYRELAGAPEEAASAGRLARLRGRLGPRQSPHPLTYLAVRSR